MLIVLFLIILALLPLALTQAFPHLLMVSIYAGIFPWFAIAWAVFWITITYVVSEFVNGVKSVKKEKNNNIC